MNINILYLLLLLIILVYYYKLHFKNINFGTTDYYNYSCKSTDSNFNKNENKNNFKNSIINNMRTWYNNSYIAYIDDGKQIYNNNNLNTNIISSNLIKNNDLIVKNKQFSNKPIKDVYDSLIINYKK